MILHLQPVDQIGDMRDVGDAADTMARRPDVTPCRALVGRRGQRLGKFTVDLGRRRCAFVRGDPGLGQARGKEIGIDARHTVGLDNVLYPAVEDHRLVVFRRAAFGGADEPCAEIGKIGPHHLGSGDIAACRHCPGQHQRTVEDLADLVDQRKGTGLAGMAAGTGRHRDQPVHPGLDGLGGVTQIDHIVKYQTAIIMHRADQLRNSTKRGNNKRDPVAGDHLQLFTKNIVAAMHDQIDAKGRRRPAGLGLDGGKALANDGQPFIKPLAGTLVLCRKAANDAGTTTGQHHLRPRGKEHRRGNHGKPEPAFKGRGKRHGGVSSATNLVPTVLAAAHAKATAI